MSSALIVDGKEYVPATIAGKHFSYSKDYLLMLIKGGKIDGQKIGNKWYVNLSSASIYFKLASEEREKRRKEVSAVRKAELKQYSHKTKKQSVHARIALVETLVIVVIGLSLGATGYLGTASQQASVATDTSSFLATIAEKLYTFVRGKEETITVVAQTPETETEIVAHLGAIGTTTHTSLVVAPDELFTATSIESIQDSFSDPVSVSIDPENPQTGIITPEFKEGKGEAYRFLMVPVTPETP